MTTRTLILRSLRFHARSHFGALLGAAIGTAVLVGALVVGDSVRGSLREMALERLAGAQVAIQTSDRFFSRNLLKTPIAGLAPTTETNRATRGRTLHLVSPPNKDRRHSYWFLYLPAIVSRQDAAARANRVAVYGVESGFFPFPQNEIKPGTVILNEALRRHLGVNTGDPVILRVHKPSALSQDAVISPRGENGVALRLTVAGVAPESLGNFSLSAAQTKPFNAFVQHEELGRATDKLDRANILIAGDIVQTRSMENWRDRVVGYVEGALALLQAFVPKAADRVERNLDLRLPKVSDSIALAEMERYLAAAWTLNDAELTARIVSPLPTNVSSQLPPMVELGTRRIFLDPPVVQAALIPAPTTNASAYVSTVTNGIGILTYLVNLIQAGERSTPYSMVTATSAPWVPADMADDEIIVNEWLAEDLAVKPGDSVQLTYYLADSASALAERTNSFRVHSVVPMSGIYADRTLMPEFPGIAKAESTHEWDAAFPLVHKIRDKDEAYWKQHRGTPKAFITLAAGQKMWASRFGNLTAIRWLVPTNTVPEALANSLAANLRANLDPASVGLKFEPVRERALKSVEQAQDFGGLFLGFSFFLIAAALALMWLLFQFGVEQRAKEVGTLLALGFTPRQVRRLLLLEGGALALIGGVLGVVAGTAYARAMLHGLSTVWRSAVGTSTLQYHAEPLTLVIGAVSGFVIALLTIWLALRKQARQPARELLAEGAEERGAGIKEDGRSGRWSAAVGIISGLAAFALVGFGLASEQTSNPGLFFGAGALLLLAGLLISGVLLRKLLMRASVMPSLNDLGLRNAARRRKRSLAVIGSLACGSFLIASIGVFRLDANADATKRSSGTGGFAFIGQSTLPIVKDLNTEAGLDHYGLDTKELAEFAPFRVREGDDASCLNLNRAQQPRLLGVQPEMLAGRFTFAKFIRSS